MNVSTPRPGRTAARSPGDNGLWALPGGGMEMTDSLPGTAVREVKEETDGEVRHFLEGRDRPCPG
jgi:8-oxo-dGTP pyrophosphatase MutT (NUDIX family)